MSANLVGQGVVNRDGKIKPTYGVADPSIFSNNGGPSIAEMMMVERCNWFRADNARQAGWEQMRKRLSAGDDPSSTLLLFHESCDNTIRTLPYLQHDERNSEDLDTDAEDHAADETRYAVMSRPSIRTEKKPPTLDLLNARSQPTINELVSRQSARNRAAQTRY
jgi:hypothetical protein